MGVNAAGMLGCFLSGDRRSRAEIARRDGYSLSLHIDQMCRDQSFRENHDLEVQGAP
jgi:hypothetical protein